MTCSKRGCDKPVVAKRLCRSHYNRANYAAKQKPIKAARREQRALAKQYREIALRVLEHEDAEQILGLPVVDDLARHPLLGALKAAREAATTLKAGERKRGSGARFYRNVIEALEKLERQINHFDGERERAKPKPKHVAITRRRSKVKVKHETKWIGDEHRHVSEDGTSISFHGSVDGVCSGCGERKRKIVPIGGQVNPEWAAAMCRGLLRDMADDDPKRAECEALLKQAEAEIQQPTV